MTTGPLTTLFTGGSYFEGPRWHEGSWWVSDFYAHQVTRVSPNGEGTVVTEVEQQPSGLDWLPDGAMVIVSMKDRRLLRLADGELSTTPISPRTAAARSTTASSTRPAACSSATSASI